MTDLTRWRLFVERGRQVWCYLGEDGTNAPWQVVPDTVNRAQGFIERYLLGLDYTDDVEKFERTNDVIASLRNAMKFYSKLQTEDGHWSDDYGGPMFLMPGLIFTCYISGVEIPDSHKKEMKRYLYNHQNSDGGWGLHIESHSTIFGTALNYVAIRILGESRDTTVCVDARKFLHSHGGAKGIPSWGKFWLASLGLYEWTGLNPLPPELWMLPYWFPFHPGRFWCHCRMVYLPMCYVFGRKSTMPLHDLTKELRHELYPEPYDSIDWPSLKWHCSPLDVYAQPSLLCKLVFGLVSIYEKFHIPALRKAALDEVWSLIRVEDESTKFIDIGPVNKTINMLSVYWHEGEKSENFKKHTDRIWDYLWLAEDGMKMQGYNGSQLWDTAFALQALVESGLGHEFPDMLKKGHDYLEVTQVREEVPNMERWYRHRSKGAWPFSTRDHGWPISDCTSEGLKAALLLKQFNFITPLEDPRYAEAVDVILSLQNADGGWPTYELKRGPDLTELLNPSECFYDIMVDYSYVECTSSCIKALAMFRKHFPNYLPNEINASIKRGINYIKKKQRPDGSWLGSWAVCVSYAMWYVIDGLMYAGESPNAPYIKKACEYLVSKQRTDGGWGESFQSCVKHDWVEHEQSQTVHTSWCVIALTRADWNKEPIQRGVEYLMRKQKDDGDWAQESVLGVFNANCAISYSGYKNIFSIWALSCYINKFIRKTVPIRY